MPSASRSWACVALVLLVRFEPEPALAQAAATADSLVSIESRIATCASTQGLAVHDATIDLAFDPSNFSVDAMTLCRWVANAAVAVDAYFGRFPVRHVRVELNPVPGRGVQGGTTYGNATLDSGPLTTIRLGREVTRADLDGDWIMTHELVHLAVPSVPRRSHWLEEGIATYVEPFARLQQGQLSAEKVWGDMLRGMPNGLPREGDRGLDRTPTWGRTYWGGALFCLVADVEIRRLTRNRFGLRDALRGVVAKGGNMGLDWNVSALLEVGDNAIGVNVLGKQYSVMSATPASPDLDALWRQLGVSLVDGRVRFDDSAPLASIRHAINAVDREPAHALGAGSGSAILQDISGARSR